MPTERFADIYQALEQKRPNDVMSLIKTEITEFPLQPQGWVFLGNALEMLNRPYEALSAYRRGWLLNPTAPWAESAMERLKDSEQAALDPWLVNALSVPSVSITAAIIARNEARCIARCLESLQNAVDDIVVVDTGPTDDTKVIAGAHGARVFDFEWNDDFAAARNFALAQVKTEWVLWVDADEWLDSEDMENPRIAAGLFSQLDIPIILHVVQVNPLPARTESAYDIPRMHPTGYGISWKRRIHEQLTPPPDLGAWPSPPAQVNIRLLHDGYDAAVIDRSSKLTRNIVLLRQSVLEDPDDISAWGFLGRDLYHHDEYYEAIKAFEELESRVGPYLAYRQHRLPEMRTFYIAALISTGQFEAAHALALRGTQENPDYPIHWFDLGKLELRLLEMRLSNARTAFQTADQTAKTWQGGTSLDPSIGRWRAKAGLGDVAKLSGNIIEAVRIYQATYKSAPEAEPIRKSLITLRDNVIHYVPCSCSSPLPHPCPTLVLQCLLTSYSTMLLNRRLKCA